MPYAAIPGTNLNLEWLIWVDIESSWLQTIKHANLC